jgi:hypothetical protein
MKPLLLFLALALATTGHAREFVSANDQARFLAGLPVSSGSPLAALTKDAAWTQHATEMDDAWAKCERQSLSKTRAWAGKFVKSSGSSAPCYYMFSGPDILYAHTIYPNASTYVLCGIEPIGSVPDLEKASPERIAGGLAAMRRSLSNVLRFSYFITKDMKVDLGGGTELSGTVPILYFFLARMGCDITNVEYINIGKGVPGVRIDFRRGLGTQTVYYFKGDLSNGGSGSAVMNYCRKLGPDGLGLLKAASYLLHEGGFSSCRDFLLSNCRVMVQDDSGIPHHFYNPQRWQMRYFGTYVGTTGGPFSKYYQPDLGAAYTSANAAPIDFQLSYQWDTKKANLMVAVRTGGAPEAPKPAPQADSKPKKTSGGSKPAAKPSAQTESENPFSFLFGPKQKPAKAPATSSRTLRLKTS